MTWRTYISVAVVSLGLAGMTAGMHLAHLHAPVLQEQWADAIAQDAEAQFRAGDVAAGEDLMRQLSTLAPGRARFEHGRFCVFGLIGTNSPDPDWSCAAGAFADAAELADPETRAKALLYLVELDDRGHAAANADPVSLLARSTQYGNQEAARELAVRLLDMNTPRERTLGIRLLRKASWTDPEAAIALATLYQTGAEPIPSRHAIEDLIDRATAQLHAQASSGQANAMLSLGRLLASDTFGRRDPVQAVVWFDRAAAMGKLDAQVTAALLQLDQASPVFDVEVALARLSDAAGRGSSSAAYRLGLIYSDGILAARDLDAARAWFDTAATLGSNAAKVRLAQLLFALGDDASKRQAMAILEGAALDGGSDAALALGDLLAQHPNLAGLSARPALAWHLMAARLGNARAMARLAQLYEAGSNGLVADEEAALTWTRRAVEMGYGNTSMMLTLADAYRYGAPTLARDPVRAAFWYEQAAERGSTTGMMAIAEAYRTGAGVPLDPERAVGWYMQAAENGSISGIQQLAFAYASGFGVDVDPVAAFRLFYRAAQAGSRIAQREVGRAYVLGYGIEADPQRALAFFRAAAAQGETDSMLEIAFAYREGIGVPVDRAAAIDWLRRASALADKNAQFLLGRAYLEGDGIPRDPLLARHWLHSARALGSHAAEHLLIRMDGDTVPEAEG